MFASEKITSSQLTRQFSGGQVFIMVCPATSNEQSPRGARAGRAINATSCPFCLFPASQQHFGKDLDRPLTPMSSRRRRSRSSDSDRRSRDRDRRRTRSRSKDRQRSRDRDSERRREREDNSRRRDYSSRGGESSSSSSSYYSSSYSRGGPSDRSAGRAYGSAPSSDYSRGDAGRSRADRGRDQPSGALSRRGAVPVSVPAGLSASAAWTGAAAPVAALPFAAMHPAQMLAANPHQTRVPVVTRDFFAQCLAQYGGGGGDAGRGGSLNGVGLLPMPGLVAPVAAVSPLSAPAGAAGLTPDPFVLAPKTPAPSMIALTQDSNVTEASNIIVQSLLMGECPPVVGSGQEAMFAAVEAVMKASKTLHQRRAGMHIRCTPQFTEKTWNNFSLQVTKTPRLPEHGHPTDLDESAVQDIKVKRTSSHSSVAGCIAKRVRDGERVVMTTIGPECTMIAVKSVTMARSFLENDAVDLSFQPHAHIVTLPDAGGERRAIKFRVLVQQI
eukprot:g36716.t1